MCGICAIVTNCHDGSEQLQCMLQKLRHRGYDSWGTSQLTSSGIICNHFTGSVPSESSTTTTTTTTTNQTAFLMGHTRYTTKGSHTDLSQAQPLINTAQTISLVHNGQIECPENFQGSDSLYMLQVLEHAFSVTLDDQENIEIFHPALENIFYQFFNQINGSYACVVQIVGLGMFAFRDPRGIRPLCFQQKQKQILFASESCAFDLNDRFYDVAPGEVIYVNLSGELFRLHPFIEPNLYPEPCLFEFIYLAHDDSVIDGISVREARKHMGAMLVDKIHKSGIKIDIVIPIPHTPVLAGKVLAEHLGVKFVEALEVCSENRRESRTFILPTQSAREEAVQNKFCQINSATIDQCRGKNILILDDSIVRGTTMHHVVKLIRASIQPANLYVASLAPPIVNINRFGIDIPSTELLVACSAPLDSAPLDIPEIVQAVFCVDGPVIYQSLETLKNGLKNLSQSGVAGFEDSVFR